MELSWLIYSLLGLFFIWFADFTKKVMLKNWWNKDVFLFVCFSLYMVALTINFWFNFDTSSIDSSLVKSSFIIWFFDFITPIWMLAWLKYLDTSFMFISTRLSSSFFILFIGIYILGDTLSAYNIIWFLLWVISLFLLSWFSFKEKHNINKKGILAIFVALTWMIWAHSYFKYIVNDINIDTFMFLKFWFSLIFLIIYMLIRKKFEHFNKIEIKKIFKYAIVSCFLFVSYFLYILPQMYMLWTLSLSYKMISYSLFVPVLLSLIVYREEISKKKIFAILLTVLSVTLFIL